MKVKVQDLNNKALDWAVDYVIGNDPERQWRRVYQNEEGYKTTVAKYGSFDEIKQECKREGGWPEIYIPPYHALWTVLRPLLNAYKIDFITVTLSSEVSTTSTKKGKQGPTAYGPNRRVAACRAVYLDYIIDIPEELL